jgi:hypothetical protein
MVQLSATRYSYIAILWVSLMSSAAMTLCVASQLVFLLLLLLLLLLSFFVIDSFRKLFYTPSYITFFDRAIPARTHTDVTTITIIIWCIIVSCKTSVGWQCSLLYRYTNWLSYQLDKIFELHFIYIYISSVDSFYSNSGIMCSILSVELIFYFCLCNTLYFVNECNCKHAYKLIL